METTDASDPRRPLDEDLQDEPDRRNRMGGRGLIRVRVARIVIVTDADGRLLAVRLAEADDEDG